MGEGGKKSEGFTSGSQGGRIRGVLAKLAEWGGERLDAKKRKGPKASCSVGKQSLKKLVGKWGGKKTGAGLRVE